eukprot:scaffold1.g5492.t1
MGSASPSLETIIAEAYLKCANIVLASRLPALQPARVDAAEASKRRAWFNIEVPEDAGAASTLQRWRKDVGLPLVLEVFLQPWGARDPLPGGEQAARVETLLERWVLHYHPMLPESPTTLSRSQLLRLNPSSVYKRLVIMLRSLYSYVCLLPAYRMYRACKRQRSASFGIGYRLHSTLPGRAAGAAPGMRRLQHFAFAPVDTPYGQFRASVDYQPASTVTILEQTTSPPPLPQIIADYVGSPRAAAGAASARGLPLRHAMSASAFGGERGGGAAPAGAAAQPLSAASPPGLPPLLQRASGSSSGGGSTVGLGTTPPARRSWSTTMRGLSPNRLGSLPSGELPSPSPPSPYAYPTSAGAFGAAYGSAPLHGGVLGPQTQRSLSISTRPSPGSPGGKPPLARPRRASAGAQPGSARADTAEAGGPGPGEAEPPSPGGAAQAGREEDAAGGCGGVRRTSAPVCIPAPPGAQGRRLRSSGDLWAMQQAANMHKPLSAPAVTHMRGVTPGGGGGGAAEPAGPPAGGDSLRREPSLPPTPRGLPLIPGTVESESSGSATSSLFPTSCSPQLPFAFTPSAQSGASFGRGPLLESVRLERASPRHHRTSSGASASGPSAQQQAAAARAAPATAGAGSGAGTRASPPVVGREVSASTALMRRPSWAARSGASFQGEAPGAPGGVGYSVSPMGDATFEALLAGSTPRVFAAAGALGPGALGQLASPGLGGPPITVSRLGSGARHLLTYPAASGDIVIDETDVLPFALDGDAGASPNKPASPAPPGVRPPVAPTDRPAADDAPAGAGATAGSEREPAAAGAAAEPSSDAAVGAFVRLLQEAPPLRFVRAPAAQAAPGLHGASAGSELTLQAGLQHLHRVRQRLQEQGVLPTAVHV